MKNNRIIYLDVIKIFAMFLVIMVHISSKFISDLTISSTNLLISNIFDSVSRAGVPIFLMVSGSILLNENKTFTFKKMIKYIKNILIVLVFWSFLYALFLHIIKPLLVGNPIQIYEFFYKFIFGYSHLWYLFMLIGIYLLTPVLKLFVNKKNVKYVEYFIILSLIFIFSIPLINFFFNEIFGLRQNIFFEFIKMFNIEFIGGYITYYIMGWYLTNFTITSRRKKIFYIIGIFNLILTILLSQMFTEHIEIFYSYLNINVFFYSSSLFLFLVNLLQNRIYKKTNLLILLSNLSFGIYLVHPFFIVLVTNFVNFNFVLLSILFQFLIVFILSFIIVYFISRNKYLKKIIRV